MPFAATGGTALRTLPDRLADIINVKDFGAKGDGTTDDQPAIQAAVNWTAATGSRGIIFFPPGTYKLGRAIDLTYAHIGSTSASFILRGCGSASTLVGNFADYLIKRAPTSYAGYSGDGVMIIEDLSLSNGSSSSAAGCIQIVVNVTCLVNSCKIGITGGCGVNLTNGNMIDGVNALFNFTGTVMNCSIKGGGKTVVGSNGIALCQGGMSLNNDISAFETGIRMYGGGTNVIGGRIEVCGTGILTGADPLGNRNAGFQGFTIQGLGMESNSISIDLSRGGVVGAISGVYATALDGSGIDGIRLPSSGVSTVTLISVQMIGNLSGYAITCGVGAASSPLHSTLIDVKAQNTNTEARNWLMPTAAWLYRFINCNNPAALFTFANLPAGPYAAPVEGDEYLISDSPQAMVGNFGAIVSSGGGSNHVKVRWNGTNWMVV